MQNLRTETELAEARQLTIRSILNPYYRAMPPDLEEANALLQYMITQSSRHNLAWGYYVDGKMVAFLMSFPAR